MMDRVAFLLVPLVEEAPVLERSPGAGVFLVPLLEEAENRVWFVEGGTVELMVVCSPCGSAGREVLFAPPSVGEVWLSGLLTV